MEGSTESGVTFLLTLMVGLIGVTSAALGFIADEKRLTAGDIYVDYADMCVYPVNSAHALGISAILLLMAAQIIASVAGGCCGCGRQGFGVSKSKRRVVAVVASFLSWIMTAIAVWNYWRGVDWNTPGTRRATISDEEECFCLKGRVFTRAAGLTIVVTLLATMSCFLLRTPAATAEPVEGAAEPKPNGKNGPGLRSGCLSSLLRGTGMRHISTLHRGDHEQVQMT